MIRLRWIAGILIILVIQGGWPTGAFSFSSGSTGALGAFNPTVNTTVTLPPDGILNYTTVNIPSGVTVTFTPNVANTPVTMLATGNMTIAGIVNLDGANGANPLPIPNPVFNPGVPGGPGGFGSGAGGSRGIASSGIAGIGPGAGLPNPTTGGGSGIFGAPGLFVSLTPLFGGSGGAGGGGGDVTRSGGAGGGGGGAIVIASTTTITLTGTIRAEGGLGGAISGNCTITAGSGSGGAVRLVATQLTGTGTILARGGSSGLCNGIGGNGRIRLEAATLTFTGSMQGDVSQSTVPGPVTPASDPPLVNFPTLAFSSIGGLAVPSNPTGSLTAPDVTLPTGTSNPVPVVLTATSTPVPTTFTVQVDTPNLAQSSVTAASSGSFTTSSATTNVTLPSGQPSLLLAFAGFVITPQMASLFPLIDGEPVEQILLAATIGEPSTLSLVTKSGKTVPVYQLSLNEQRRVALAWEILWTSH